MKAKLVFLITILALACSNLAFAGNANNSGSNGAATAIVICYNTPETFPSFFTRLWDADIVVEGCDGNGFPVNDTLFPDDVDCNGDSFGSPSDYGASCAVCLNRLQALGMTVVSAQADTMYNPDVEYMNYLLTGNAGPLVNRLTEAGACNQ